jgi:hypothetical protein
MEQIYTIPVNEAFEASRDDHSIGCPLCALYRKLEENELDIILGASMMEPDIRIKTNEQGFCADHYSMMLKRKRMLGIALMLDSHLPEVERRLDGPVLIGNKPLAAVKALTELEDSCYVCGRIEKNLSMMIATVAYLFETDFDFRRKYEKIPYICLPHYRRLLDYASKKMSKRNFAEFYEVAHGLEKQYITELRGDVNWFCKKFDYQNEAEPWYNSKDSVYRAIKFLDGDMGDEE